MPARVWIEDLWNYVGREVVVKGWVHRLRILGGINFALIRDRSGVVQVVDEKKLLSNFRHENVVEISGEVIEEKRAPGGIEIRLRDAKLLGEVYYDSHLPVQIYSDRSVSRLKLETLLKYRVLTLRNPRQRAIFRVMNTVVDAFRDYLKSQKFTEIHTSKIVASATEGGAELFKIDYFGRKAFLAQSPQFYKQIMVGVFERVFEVGFVYRAEKHDTPRHLNEYLSLDVEMGFISGLDDLLDLETGLLKHIFKRVREENEEELKLFNAQIPDIEFIPRLTLKEATGILKEEFGKPVIGLDLDAEGERLITEYARKKWGTELVFITHYPLSKRPMYTYPDPANPELSLSFDLIFRGLEITTGGQRIHNYRLLVEKIKERGLNPDDFSYYLDAFKFGMPPHGGFAIGAERLVSRILNLPNIRMASLFPRDRHHLHP